MRRRASFRAYCDPGRTERLCERWLVGFRRRAAQAAQAAREADERAARRLVTRSMIRLGVMFVTGAVVDRVMGAP